MTNSGAGISGWSRCGPATERLKALLDEWLSRRSNSLRTDYLFTDHGRGISAWRVDSAVKFPVLTSHILMMPSSTVPVRS
jgi:hypothetical protein